MSAIQSMFPATHDDYEIFTFTLIHTADAEFQDYKVQNQDVE